jgi:hypothetical protein
MTSEAYRYTLQRGVSLPDAIESLYLAIFSAEGLYGRAQVRLDAGYCFDAEKRALVVDASTPVGRTISQIFTGLLGRQFGEDAFAVEHVSGSEPRRGP